MSQICETKKNCKMTFTPEVILCLIYNKLANKRLSAFDTLHEDFMTRVKKLKDVPNSKIRFMKN